MKTVLITGHLGFVGKALTKQLKEKYNVIGLDRKNGNDILFCDLPDCDIVVHLAARTGVRESLLDHKDYWQVNVDGSKRILSHYHDKRVLVASSSSQYEPHLNPYAASKHIMETIPHDNVCWMRFHTIYSSEPRSGMFFDKLFNRELEYVTDHERDFIHVDDICKAIELLLEHSFTGPLDVGTGKTIKISDICPTLPIKNNTKYERTKTKADITTLSSFGFVPSVDIEEFIANNIRR